MAPVAWSSGNASAAHLHIQKTGGTTLYLDCIQRCSSTVAGRALQGFLSQDAASTDRGEPCGCRAFIDAHWTFHELSVVKRFARRRSFPLCLTTMIRDPADRVISEYEFLRNGDNGPHALHQDQWDYIDQRQPSSKSGPPVLSPLGQRLLERSKPFSLSDFIEHSPGHHPAINRQTRYLGSLEPRVWLEAPYPDGCCMNSVVRMGARRWAEHHFGLAVARELDEMLGRVHRRMQSQPNASHALPEQPTDADLGRALSRIKYEFAVVGVLERAPESALAFAKHLGWSSAWPRQRSALQHEDRLPWRRHQDVSPGLRQRILEKNQHDDVLYRLANELLDGHVRDAHAWPRPRERGGQVPVCL